jgi:glycerol-3-phosphate acyltransferase PlsY
MSRISTVLLIAVVFVGIIGAVGFLFQAFQHLRSKTPIATKKNLMLRAAWLLTLFVLLIALLISISMDSSSLLCSGLIFTGISGLVLFAGYFMERQFNRAISDPIHEDSIQQG